VCKKPEVGLACKFHRQGEHEKQVLRFAQDDNSFIVNETNKLANIFTVANCRIQVHWQHGLFAGAIRVISFARISHHKRTDP
jgi:hypothetical protein